MEKLWLITNIASGSASEEKCAALEAIFEERGLALAGRTFFPDEPLPETEDLVGAGCSPATARSTAPPANMTNGPARR
jgi:hypothetical protein